jgi:4-diphosphocytidyl-2-C-methyl-D-erythritol kinase
MKGPSKRLSLSACAKINLSLLVGPKRSDGYHQISTIMAKVSLCDCLEFSPIPEGVEASSSDPRLPCDENNTVFRAARLLTDRFSPQCGASIHIEKRIPWGAGLGGGSSDAATALMGLNRLWGLGLSKRELMALGAEIGSDVPFFFSPSAAIAQGRGEILRPFMHGLKARPLVVYPNIEVSTKWAYGAINPRLTLDETVTNIAALSCKRGDVSTLAQTACNDFEGVVFGKHPVLGEVVESLKAMGAAFAGMSGSGSSLFGLFTREEDRERAYLWAQERGFSVWAAEWVNDGV